MNTPILFHHPASSSSAWAIAVMSLFIFILISIWWIIEFSENRTNKRLITFFIVFIIVIIEISTSLILIFSTDTHILEPSGTTKYFLQSIAPFLFFASTTGASIIIGVLLTQRMYHFFKVIIIYGIIFGLIGLTASLIYRDDYGGGEFCHINWGYPSSWFEATMTSCPKPGHISTINYFIKKPNDIVRVGINLPAFIFDVSFWTFGSICAVFISMICILRFRQQEYIS